MSSTDLTRRLARAKFRAWHRGTREADYTFGCFFDTYHAEWEEAELAWFEALLEHEDPDVLAWTMGTAPPPEPMQGAQMEALLRLDYVRI
ncbi:succinate dehydrogenase assembly factor 2 [Erythrobacter arachoides]|uniref:FAD assembly factor SdhE n=1 Tax=Aurantiacibacter arachoides TaxID=1850444 RepID=A0A844ZZ68_9SPHN|nr:succinate dehydrogenase assembly factor 2 [Aurantiacibacter arachoides]MXO93008.1 succinate dehydrogenase assembly factor 2 [Aurantiacibacter arachoides]GGD52724.1 hypothetical protein GCM10011411_10780 [Aurantiacibacter arachoides]